jgi:hypothetical protein
MTRELWRGHTPYDMLDRNRKRMRLTMLVGMVLDVILALSALLFPAWLLALMGVARGQEIFCLQFWPLIHLVFPCFYVLAWVDVKRNVAIVAGAVLARSIYALFMFVSVWVRGASWAWAVAGGLSLALAVSHYVFLRLSDFGFWEVLSQAGNPPRLEGR